MDETYAMGAVDFVGHNVKSGSVGKVCKMINGVTTLNKG